MSKPSRTAAATATTRSPAMARKQPNGNPDTRENLLQLAARAFGIQGYSATSMRAIAEQAGIEAASIYYHFPSKEALVDEVMAHGADAIVEHLQQRLDALPADATSEQRLRAAVAGQMSALTRYGDYALAHSRLLAQLPQPVQERQVKRREAHQKLWTRLLEDVKRDGLLRDEVDIHLCRVFILGCINSVQTWFNPRKGSVEAAADQVCTIFFDGVRRR